MDCYDNDASWVYRIDKNVLCLTDEQINEIIEHDRKQKEEKHKHKLEAEKARQQRLKKEVEQKEYKQYLRLKKKFEKK